MSLQNLFIKLYLFTRLNLTNLFLSETRSGPFVDPMKAQSVTSLVIRDQYHKAFLLYLMLPFLMYD